MRSKHFQNRARREWWSVHVEAWRRSGLSQRRYCAQHRLDKKTFARWLMVVGDAKALQHKERRQRLGPDKKLSRDKRSKAVQAFWAMHVEAMTWCGMTVHEYAAAHRTSPHSLRRWRGLIETGEVEIDCRAHLHPSARPKISTGVSTGAKEPPVESTLTDATIAEPPLDRRSNRRSFTDDEKLAIVTESTRADVSVVAVARRHGIVPSMIFRWRVQFGVGKHGAARLASVTLVEEQPERKRGTGSAPLVLQNLLPIPDGMEAVDLADGRRVFAPAGADPAAVRQQVAEQEAAR